MASIDFRTTPSDYRHWRLEIDGSVARLVMDVDEDGGLFSGYQLKLNSYDLGVDIELYDALQRLRFEHPEVRSVVLQSANEKVFCAGANIRMLATATHAHKVNFCKFTNETRNAMEEASACSGQRYLAAIRGSCAGGGYELALATDYILLADDGSSSVALPEVPLLAVLPGTGGLTRLTDKRKVRRDRADVFCTVEEGMKGERAKDWNLVDEVVPASKFEARIEELVSNDAEVSSASSATGIELPPLERHEHEDGMAYTAVTASYDRSLGVAYLTLSGPDEAGEANLESLLQQGAHWWPLRLARELDDAILHLRFNESDLGTLVFESSGDIDAVAAFDRFLDAHRDHWLAREIRLYWKRTMKRIDLTSRSLVALVRQGSCFAGFLAEIVFAADRSYMLEGQYEEDERSPAVLLLGQSAFGDYPMSNGLGRLATRFWGDDAALEAAREAVGRPLEAVEAESLGLVTFVFDDLDWDDEVRIFLEERASFSADSMVGLEANLRFPGPETMETRIFGRLSAWQNWIFQRPSAAGEEGALKRYGTGRKGVFDPQRV